MSEQLNYQQLKNIKQVAKVCGMDDMGTIENSTGTFSIDGSKISGDISGNAAGITGSITAANLSLSTADTLDCNISGNAAFASAAEAGSALETTLNEKLDAANAVTHTATVHYYMQQIYTAQQNIQVFAGHGLMVGDIIVNTTGFEDGTKVSAITENSLGYSIISLNKNWIPNVLSNSINVIGIRDKAVFNSINDNKMGALYLDGYFSEERETQIELDSQNLSFSRWLFKTDPGGYLTYGGVDGGAGSRDWGTWDYGTYGLAVHRQVAARGYYAYSDERIKENIEDVPDALALDQVRQLPCRYYQYKDKVTNGPGTVIGFIAQEVKEVLPSAVNTATQFIPDHLRLGEVTWEDVDGKHFMTVSNLNEDVVAGTTMKFHCYTGTPAEFNEDGSLKTPPSENYAEVTKEVIMNEEGKFAMDGHYDGVYISGKLVHDFLHIDKQRIFALHHSAIQELDRTVETQKTTISNLQSTVESQQAVLNTLLARVAVLEG